MSMIIAWVVFPLVLAALGAGWGAIVESASGELVSGALIVPLGLAAALVIAGSLTTFDATARAAVPVVAVGALAGLALGARGRRFGGLLWPLAAAVGVLLAYGAPVILSGQATFTGYLRLDDTATWFNVIDHVMSHARSVSGEAKSTFSLVYSGDVGPSYPLGAFMLPGLGRALVGMDIAWVFQPYLACCGAALALVLFALMESSVPSARVRALLAFTAAQSALLYGYSLWGGIKELTAAFLLALGVALAAAMLARPPRRWRQALPLATAAGALIQVLGPGAGGWVAPAVLVLFGSWILRGRGLQRVRASAAAAGWLTILAAACVIPVWAVVSKFFSNKGGTFEGLFSSGQTQATRFGNLIHSLSAAQLSGIWPIGDFRLTAPTTSSVLLIGVALLAALGGLWVSVRRREFGLGLYVAVALSGCGVLYFSGGTPWVTGKALAISSPALLTAALSGGAMLWRSGGSRRARGLAGALVMATVIGGVLWSNVLGYHDATLAPRARLAELQHIGGMLKGKGPTFINSYEIYADRHFLRAGAPVEPAEYREATLPLLDGTILTKAAAADLDSFPLSTLEPYRSIVTARSPVESRPPSIYRLIWQGPYYQLWQRPARPTTHILEHVPLGDSSSLPYCGQAQEGPSAPLCSIDPAATPSCEQIKALGHRALSEGATLVAYQRPEPIVARGDQTQWPGLWLHYVAGHTLTATAPGVAISHIEVANTQTYELWLGGTFTRGFRVSVDGRHVGAVKDQLSAINGYVHVANVPLTPGVHTLSFEYPHADLTPGSGENELTSLSEIALEPQQNPASEMITVAPRDAAELCGRTLDWIELTTTS